ncbi:MAG TPA: phage holin family protein [Methylophilaceae bacterium]|nr:phage holin family protein [Methylophilaceae bacterium]
MRAPDPNTGAGRPVPDGKDGGVLGEAGHLWHEVRLLVHDQLKLAALETRLVAESLVSMVATSVAVVLLLVTAWLGLVSAGVVALIEWGLAASVAILIAVVLNVVIALLLGMAIRRQVSHLQWPATLRSLRPGPQEPLPPDAVEGQPPLGPHSPPYNNTRH